MVSEHDFGQQDAGSGCLDLPVHLLAAGEEPYAGREAAGIFSVTVWRESSLTVRASRYTSGYFSTELVMK